MVAPSSLSPVPSCLSPVPCPLTPHPSLPPPTFGQKGFQGQAAGDGVLGVAPEPAVLLGDGADLAENLSVGVEFVEHVSGGRQEVDLVRGDQRAQRERVTTHKIDLL